MDCYATAPRLAAEPRLESLESAIAGAAHRSRGAHPDLTPVLMRYWHELARHDARQRRDWLTATHARVRAGQTSTRALIVHALGDADEDIVFDAVTEYAGTHPVSIERRRAVVAEAADWVRRGLALNRGAVVAALLALGDATVDESLAGLRLVLTHAEIAVVCRRAAARSTRATRAFLQEWLALLDAAERPDAPARQLVARALEAATP